MFFVVSFSQDLPEQRFSASGWMTVVSRSSDYSLAICDYYHLKHFLPGLADLSRRLGIAIVITPRQSSTSSSVRRLSTTLNYLSFDTPLSIFLKLHAEPSVKGELNIYTKGHGPLT